MPFKELERLTQVNRFLELEIEKETQLKEITALTAKVCNTPVALITLLNHDTQHVRFKVGTALENSPRENAFCDLVIKTKESVVIEDARKDARFDAQPLAKEGIKVRFYAGIPLTTLDGHCLGSLCVTDRKPRKLEGYQLQMLDILSKQIIHLLEFDNSLRILKELYIKAKDSTNKLRSFFDASSSIHLLIDLDMNIAAYNNKAKESFGPSMKKGVATTTFFADYANDFIINFKRCVAGERIAIEKSIETSEGPSWWHVTYGPAKDKEGQIIGVSFNASDISQQVSQEQKLYRQELALKQIAWMQSHELRKPVSSILGLMEIIENENYKADKDILQKMKDATEELDEKINLIVNQTF